MLPVLRRPAAIVKAVAKPAGRGRKRLEVQEVDKAAEKKEAIKAAEVTVEQCRDLADIEVIKGTYWEAEVQAAL